jgi:hypothetical protein
VTTAPEVQPISSSAAVWQRYDSTVKAELWSTALRTSAGVYLVDPISVDWHSLAEFTGGSAIAGVIVTNENHLRDAPSFCSQLGAPLLDISAPPLSADVQMIDLPGAPAGEIALVSSNGELVVGDALINFEPHGFTFLPNKYCTDAKEMRRSLRKLLSYSFERIFFAHGNPITSNAHQRLESLLAS